MIRPLPPRETLKAVEYSIYTTHCDPVLNLNSDFELPFPKDAEAHNHVDGGATIDHCDGRIVPDDRLKIGSQIFYPMHYRLHFRWLDLGH